VVNPKESLLTEEMLSNWDGFCQYKEKGTVGKLVSELNI